MPEETGSAGRAPLWRPQLGSIVVSILTAFYLLALTNHSFWAKGWLYLDGRPATFASIAIGIACLYIALSVAVSLKYAMKPIFIVLILASAAGAWFMDTYGVIIDMEMIRNAAETNSAEAGHLVTPGFLLHMLVYGVLPSALLIWVRVRHHTFFWKLRANLAIIVPALVIALVAGLSHARAYAAAVRSHHDWFETLNPFVPLVTAVQFAAGQSADRNIVAAPLGMDARVSDVPADQRKPRLMIVVAGETARAANFSLSGYGRETNPALAKKDIRYFRDTTSCGTATAVSLPCMFSVYTRADYSHRKGLETENLLDVLTHAGIDVEWWDNNTGSKKIAARVKERSLIEGGSPRYSSGGECRDEVLLDNLDAWIGSVKKDTVLVLHQIGSHGPAYFERYPDEFRRFTPDCRSVEFSDCTREEIVNAYDNTIAYTDHILAGVIDGLEREQGRLDVSMLYMSDHGESLGEFGLYLHGAPYMIAPGEQTHVPFVLWLGQDAKAAYSGACLDAETVKPQSHDNLFHTVLGLMRVETTGAGSGTRPRFPLPAWGAVLIGKGRGKADRPVYAPDSNAGVSVDRKEGRLRILLIEDDAVLGEAVRDYVAGLDHAVDWMQTLDDGRTAASTVGYDLILLDLRLPDGSGLTLLKELRRSGTVTPVIILTAHDQISDRIEGLNSGADDYLVKPFNLGELGARMLAVARRYAGSSLPVLEAGPLTIQLADRRVMREGTSIDLSGREWAVLARLAARPDAIVSKGQIEEALYAFGSEIESNTVEVYVSRLRKKLGKDCVETLRGIGYRLGR